MGFFDNLMKKVGASLATRYGEISSGKHEGCSIVLGNPPKAKVSTVDFFSQMIFLKENEEVARFNIADDIEDIAYIETILFPATGQEGYRCEITFADGDTCQADLFPSKCRVLYNNLKGNMRKETRDFFEEKL